ncbi:MAG: phage major capsid protein [Lactobacillus sp.]|jgi:HK97 family phage major capsid protein|nr:phage major capsid protein [Lactobacillus sp.]
MNIAEKIKALKKGLTEKQARSAAFSKQIRELLSADKTTEEDLTKAKDLRSQLDDVEAEIKADNDNIELYERALKGTPAPDDNNPEPNNNENKPDLRSAINAYIRSKGKVTDGVEMRGQEVVIPGKLLRDIVPTTDGVDSATVKPTIPVDISYTPQRELETVIDLKQFTNVFKANTASGTYPILKNTTATLVSVAELEKNPALAKPEFTDIDWKVVTYRGAIPLSQESIDDSAVDLVSIINENAQRQKLNTTNAAVSTVLKTFTAKAVTGVDDLKTINNVELDPAYQRVIVATQSFYNWLDTLKDANGRYLLQDSIISPSGKVILGMPVFVVSDESFGAKGEAHAFLGDIKRASIFADRVDITVRWVDNEIYGQYLQVATRFDVKKADEKAGFFLTYTAPKA